MRLFGLFLGLAGLIWLAGGAVAQTGDYRPWPDRVADGSWRSVAAPTASDTLIGEWNLRIYSRFGDRPKAHDRFEITSVEDGVLTGRFERGEATPFLDGKVSKEDGRTLLRFRVPARALYWTEMGREDWYTIEAEFSGGIFAGTAMGETSGLKVPWYARRAGEEDDMARYVAGNWMLDLINEPQGYCADLYDFRKDGTGRIRSGEEVLEVSWQLELVEPYKRKLVTTVLSSNGKPDCQGNITPVGRISENYVLFRNGGGMALCSGPDVGLSCYANLHAYAVASAPPKVPEKTPEQLETERLVRVFAISRHQCTGGDAEACYTVGNYRYNGTVGPVDFPLARADFKSACDLGSANGCVSLGAMMHSGTGGEKQPREARRLLKGYCTEAASSGCWNYGAMQFEGSGGRKDLKGARVSFERACTAGQAQACHTLGIMNTNALGGPVNVEAGRGLLSKACDLGVEKACEDVTALDEQAATMAWQAGE